MVTQVDRLLDQYVGESLKSVPLGNALSELVQLLREHHLRLPVNLALFFKALAMCEGVLQSVAPDVSFADYLNQWR
jgi:ubiquinone biosynthesis protein